MLREMLTFEALGHGGGQPSDFLPAALPLLLDPKEDGRTISVFGGDGEGGLRMLQADVADVVAPERLARLTQSFRDASGAPVAFGPILSKADRGAGPRTLPLPPGRSAPNADFDGAPVEVGLIDAGIAFWAPMFGDAFASMGFLDLEGFGGPTVVNALPASEIVALRGLGGSAAADRTIRAKLAADHPGSVYAKVAGAPPIISPTGFAHGVAMASLVREVAAHRRLHGLDLPRSVLMDSSGIALRSILDAAIRGVVDLAAAHHDPGRAFRMVILLAFGFPGGPQDGVAEADVLQRLRRTLDAYRAIGIAITLVVPMGNHLQDRAHAVLSAADGTPCRIDWRLLPDDHSGNAVDIFHAEGIPALTFEGPNGLRGTRPAENGAVHLLAGSRGAFGAIWTSPVGGGLSRTRVCLGPTASRTSARSLAPFGRWRLSLDCAAAEAWVLRDDAPFDDRTAPRRRSWFEDPAYRDRDAIGMPGSDDGPVPQASVRRAGSASVLAASLHPSIVPVGAQWHPPGGAGPVAARYSGAFGTGHPRSPAWVVVESGGPSEGRMTPGSASGRRFRVSGTSVAAALHAGRVARDLVP